MSARIVELTVYALVPAKPTNRSWNRAGRPFRLASIPKMREKESSESALNFVFELEYPLIKSMTTDFNSSKTYRADSGVASFSS